MVNINKCISCWLHPVDSGTDVETLSVSSEASSSSLAAIPAPRQYELPRRRPVSKSVLNKAGRPKKRTLTNAVIGVVFLQAVLIVMLVECCCATANLDLWQNYRTATNQLCFANSKCSIPAHLLAEAFPPDSAGVDNNAPPTLGIEYFFPVSISFNRSWCLWHLECYLLLWFTALEVILSVVVVFFRSHWAGIRDSH